MAKQTRVAILADLFPVLGPHTRAKALSSIKLQEMANPLIDGGGFAALHEPGMFDLPAPAVSSRIVSFHGGGGPETPTRAVDVSERAKLCRRRHGRWQRQGDSRFHPSWKLNPSEISVSVQVDGRNASYLAVNSSS
jgi:hypothetical protein